MQEVTCPACGKTVPWGKFCGVCGETLPGLSGKKPAPAEVDEEEKPPKKPMDPKVLGGTIAAVVIILIIGGILGYGSGIKGDVISYFERELRFPTPNTMKDYYRQVEKRGCKMSKIVVGIKPATEDAIADYRSRTGLAAATGTHMIWAKGSCESLGFLPWGAEIRAEKPEALPPEYHGKDMVYDPQSNSMKEVVRVD